MGSSGSSKFAAEPCPHCKGTKREPNLTIDLRCTFCNGDGVVSHFKLAMWKLKHPEEKS